MPALKVEGLNKRYEKFYLKDVSFSLDKGYIMGFIGVNGAGKTTTLKSILNIVHKDSGNVTVLGRDFTKNEISLKQEIGYMFGGVDFYSKKKLKTLTNVIKRFYANWDDEIYSKYAKRFGLDTDKKIEELSEGMKVKYSLLIALSHDAKLFILDEPTSGLDPAARDNLLELFQELIEDGERSIIFSTHITTDLEKCADYITYIHDGQIIGNGTKDDFIKSYTLVKGSMDNLDNATKSNMISHKVNSFGFTGLIKTDDIAKNDKLVYETPTLEDIMIYHSRKGENQ